MSRGFDPVSLLAMIKVCFNVWLTRSIWKACPALTTGEVSPIPKLDDSDSFDSPFFLS